MRPPWPAVVAVVEEIGLEPQRLEHVGGEEGAIG